MGEKSTSLIQRARDWGQVILICCAIGGGAVTFVSRAWGWAKAGPEAQAAAIDLNTRVTRLERQSRFTVRALEKLSGMKYQRRAGDEGMTLE